MGLERPTKKLKGNNKEPITTTPTLACALSGDALEDNFELDDDFAPSNDDDDNNDNDEELAAFSDEGQVAPASGSGSGSEVEPSSPKKRKLDSTSLTPDEVKKARKARAKEARKKKIQKAQEEEEEAGEESSLGRLELQSLMDRLTEKQRACLNGFSELELDEVRLSESMILDTSTVATRQSLMSFIREAIPTLPSTLAKPPKKNGSPRVIVVAGAALRVADLCRDVKLYKTKEIDVAKLFAKHFKLQEHVDYLRKTKVGIAIGTPSRIGKLLSEDDSLHLTHLSHLILDVTHLDAKKRSLLDQPEARNEVFKEVLGNKEIMERLKEGKMKLVFF